MLKDPHTVLPDETVGDDGRTITLGDTTLELTYLGLNHSDSTLVMRLPKEKIIFVVDFIPVGLGAGARHDRLLSAGVGGLAQEGARDGLGPADPRPSRRPGGRLGTKKDVQDLLDVPAGRLRRGEGRGPGRQVLGRASRRS